MTSVLVDGIGELVTNCPDIGDGLGILANAALVVEGDRIAWVGPSASAPPG
jgi:imidazolonepropionase